MLLVSTIAFDVDNQSAHVCPAIVKRRNAPIFFSFFSAQRITSNSAAAALTNKTSFSERINTVLLHFAACKSNDSHDPNYINPCSFDRIIIIIMSLQCYCGHRQKN